MTKLSTRTTSHERSRPRALRLSGKGLLWAALLGLLVGCGPAPAPQAPDNPPPVDNNSGQSAGGGGGGQVTQASSPKVQQGMDAIEAKDFAKAKKVLTEAHSDNPKDPQAAYYLGLTDDKLGDKQDAVDLYRQALKLDPKLVQASMNLSALLLDMNKPAEAVKVVKQALTSSPKDPGLLTNLALATEAAGDKPGAIKAYANAVAASPRNMELRFAYAENLAAAGKSDQAMAQLRQVVSDDPKLMFATGDLYARMHKFSECVGALDKVIQAKPAPGVYILRGRCRHGMKDAAGEKADYEAALKLDGKLAAPHLYLGQLYKAQGKKKQALVEFKKAAALGAGKKVGLAAKKAIAALKAGK